MNQRNGYMRCTLLVALLLLCFLSFSIAVFSAFAADGVTEEDEQGDMTSLSSEEVLTFDGVQVRLQDYAAMRVRYTVSAAALTALKGADVSFGVLYAPADAVTDADDMTLTYHSGIGEFQTADARVQNSIVYRHGHYDSDVSFLSTHEDGVSFGVCLPVSDLSSPDFGKSAEVCYRVRAYLTAIVDGRGTVYYLDMDSSLFGDAVSLREASEHFLCNGYASEEMLAVASDETLIAAAKEAEVLYLESEQLRARIVKALAQLAGASEGVPLLAETYASLTGEASSHASAQLALSKGKTLSLVAGELSVLCKVGEAARESLKRDLPAYEQLTKRREDAVRDCLSSLCDSEERRQAYTARVLAAQRMQGNAFAEAYEALPAKASAFSEASALLAKREGEGKIESVFASDSRITLADGAELSDYLIVTDEAHLELALSVFRFFLVNHGVLLGIYTSDNGYIGEHFDETELLALSIEKTEETEHFSVYYRENGALSIEGGTSELLECGIAAFLRTYCLDGGSVAVTRERLGASLVKQRARVLLAELDLPTEMTPKSAPSYDVNGVLALFYARCEDKPDEIASVSLYTPDDFPLSGKIALHVAVNGSDETGNGTASSPFATLQKALDKLAYKGGGIVYLHGGTYCISETVMLDARHSGMNSSPTIVTAYGDGDVIFTTSIGIDGGDFLPASEADFVSDAMRARLDRFTEGNSEKVYAVSLEAYGITKSMLAQYTSAHSQPSVSIGDQSYTVARYPSAGQNDESLGIVDGYIPSTSSQADVKLGGRVYDGISSLYAEYHTVSGPWEVYADKVGYADRLLGYAISDGETLYMHGAFYEEWDKRNHAFTLHEDEYGRPFMRITTADQYGVKHSSGNSVYFVGMPEDLDAPLEYYVDKESGVLYLYAPSDLAACTVNFASKQDGPIVIDGAKNVILSGFTVERANGTAVTVKNSEFVAVQNMSFYALTGNAVTLSQNRTCGVTHSTFRNSGDVNFGYDHGGHIVLNRDFVQNNRFLGGARVMGGTHGYVISHNYFFETHITVGGLEGIIEYNEFDRGNQFVVDNGPIYMTNWSRGNHVRYNYLHDLTVSQYGIYIDDMSSGSYVYGNIVHYSKDTGKYAKAVNLHNGSMNVVMNNIAIGTKGTAISSSLNYFPMVINNERTEAGSLAYRWGHILKNHLQARFDIYDHDEIASYYPLWYWYHGFVDEAVALMESDPDWDGRFMTTPKHDVDIFVRTPMMCVYMNNVAVECPKVVSVPSVASGSSIDSGNVTYETLSEVGFVDAGNGNFALREDSVIFRDIPGFENIRFDRMGVLEN